MWYSRATEKKPVDYRVFNLTITRAVKTTTTTAAATTEPVCGIIWLRNGNGSRANELDRARYGADAVCVSTEPVENNETTGARARFACPRRKTVEQNSTHTQFCCAVRRRRAAVMMGCSLKRCSAHNTIRWWLKSQLTHTVTHICTYTYKITINQLDRVRVWWCRFVWMW